jgi:hypothetical protein
MAMAEKKRTARTKAASRKRISKTTKKSLPKKPAKSRAKAEARLRAPLPSSWQLTAEVAKVWRAHWRILFGIVAVYLALNILFASGFSNLSSAVSDIKANLNAGGGSHTLARALSGFGSLVGSSGASGSASASVLQSALFVIESLVIIWALRQLLAGNRISVKEAYYHSTYPMIPFLLVLFVIILQLLPISFGAVTVSAVLTSIVSNLSVAAWLSWLFFILLACWSFYMLSSSIFALYIVTLPEMQPREALRSAKKLVNQRRLAILPRLVYLPILIVVVMAAIIIPLILGPSFLVAPVFYILSMLAILFVHSYLYAFYRSMLT